MQLFRTLLPAALLVVGGCATPTPYVPAESSDDFGYREQQISSDRWRVRFAANSVTGRETVENYLMFRAAELTLGKGRKWFVVGERDVEPRTEYYSDGPDVSPSVFYGSGGHFGVGLNIGNISSTTEYFASLDLRMLEGEPGPNEPDAYDAQDVFDHLRPTVRRDTGQAAEPDA